MQGWVIPKRLTRKLRGVKMPNDYICPECGEDLTNADIRAHLAKHWDSEPHYLQASEAYKRYHIILDMLNKEEGGYY